MTAAEKRNEQTYMDACYAVTDAEITSRVDVLAALNYLIADDCDHDAEYTILPILQKVRACVEERLTERIELRNQVQGFEGNDLDHGDGAGLRLRPTFGGG
jgi:hypothetical protein